MKCPFCGHDDDRVVESRPAREGEAIRRRRECVECGRRYTTFEEVERRPLMVVKKDGRREAFSREKVLASMAVACRKRPVPTALLGAAAEEVERRLADLQQPEVSSAAVGELVLEGLAAIDHVAYVRFASVYLEFEDPAQFRDLAASLQRGKAGRRAQRQQERAQADRRGKDE